MQRQKQTQGRWFRTIPMVKNLFGKDLSENSILIAPKKLPLSIFNRLPSLNRQTSHTPFGVPLAILQRIL